MFLLRGGILKQFFIFCIKLTIGAKYLQATCTDSVQLMETGFFVHQINALASQNTQK